MEGFSQPTITWFQEQFPGPTPIEERGWSAIASGAHSLLAAPTGSGKTLAAFLWAIDAAARDSEGGPGTRIVYISPLKALAFDVERNLRAPLAGVLRTAERLGVATRPLRVDVRTGDTSQADRRRQAKDPAEILVTTPESLFLILGSQASKNLRTVTTIIVDEIHSLAPTKRGAHLALSLERLAERCDQDPQRIGLSATARPLEEVGRFLAGTRPFEVVDVQARPKLDLQIRVPVEDMDDVPARPASDEGGPILGELYRKSTGAPGMERGIWPPVYDELVAAIRAHRTTIVFVNSRGLCERLVQRLNEIADEELARAHHGSISHGKRAEIEDALKRGDVPAIVATSSLELGIDMGAIDLVVLVESPGSVARGLQRVGRAGHQVGATSRGWIFPKFKGDLLECAVVSMGMLEGAIEAVAIPKNPLDVLSQQLVAAVCDAPRSSNELGALVRRAHPFRDLPDEALRATLDMLAGRYPSTELADLRPRLAWDRAADELTARRGAAMVTRINAGTIPDRGAFAVHLGTEDGPRLGELDEEMVYESRDGDTILLGASSWRIEEITRDRVLVSPAPGEPGRLPFWRGEGPGRPLELGRAMGAFLRELSSLSRDEALKSVQERAPLAPLAARNLVDHVFDQVEHAGALPTDDTVVIERFRDELGDWRVCILSTLGARVHAPWALAIEEQLGRRAGIDVQVVYHDDGIVLRYADSDELPPLESLLPDPEDVEELVTRRVASSSLFASLFRMNAVRSLLIPRRRPDQRSPLWAQRIKAKGLLAAVERYPDFPIVLETYRQALSDVFDLPALRDVLGRIRSRDIRVREVETPGPSPFARSLVFAYVANYLYDADSPAAERKAQALTLDRGLLRELLGQAVLRELIDAGALAEVEEELACRAPAWRARDADELHDLLRRLGDLDRGGIEQRSLEDAKIDEWLESLRAARRATAVTIAGEERWIAAEEAWLYRDALGCVVDSSLPSELLDAPPGVDPLANLIGRHARTHGPFTEEEVAARYGIRIAQVEPHLRRLEQEGTALRGEIRPGGSGLEWCDADILRRVKRRTIARLRNQIAAVDSAALAGFLLRWHGVGTTGASAPTLDEAVAQLEGLPLPWSTLVNEILPARVSRKALEELDSLGAGGRVVWVGRGARGSKDGNVELYRREAFAALFEAPEEAEPASALHAAILDHLGKRGASFLNEIENAVRAELGSLSTRDFEEAVWDLVWQSRITNDTFAPLRSLGKRRAGPSGGRWWRVDELLATRPGPTERALARAETLLARYGVVSREAARFEGLPGGFAALYRVLAAMEEQGRIRRGWFVEGLSGAQFASAGALDRLRARTSDEGAVRVLAAVDPANPWGSLLPWPVADETLRPKLRRVAGAQVLVSDGWPRLYLPPNRREIYTLGPDRRVDSLRAAFAELAVLPRPAKKRMLVIERIDGVATEDSDLRSLLEASGFVRDYRGHVPAS